MAPAKAVRADKKLYKSALFFDNPLAKSTLMSAISCGIS